MDRIQDFHLKLDFKQTEQQEAAFLQLVQHHLQNQQIIGPNRQPGKLSSAILDAAIVTFLQAYGERLWPVKKAYRQHLSVPDVSWRTSTKERSFIFSMGGRMKRGALSSWRKKHGREPTEEESLAYSQLGRAVGRYLAFASMLLVGAPAIHEGAGILLDQVLFAGDDALGVDGRDTGRCVERVDKNALRSWIEILMVFVLLGLVSMAQLTKAAVTRGKDDQECELDGADDDRIVEILEAEFARARLHSVSKPTAE